MVVQIFTFQYGQIYYTIKTNEQVREYQNLHSNMVRFIIPLDLQHARLMKAFTFQYGQIYYQILYSICHFQHSIYIPIWLDLLCVLKREVYADGKDLHSNMVRFIIAVVKTAGGIAERFTFQYGQIYYEVQPFVKWSRGLIYIPIWLDLL